jgi:hypothetical protein
MDELTEYLLEMLEEAKVTSKMPVVTQTSKIKRAAGQMANNQAKKRNDPLYQRMIKYKELYYRYRNLIHQKYGGRVRSDARK